MQTTLNEKLKEAEKLENEQAAKNIRQLEGGQAAIPLREGMAVEPVAPEAPAELPVTPVVEAPAQVAPAAPIQAPSGLDVLAGAEGALGSANVKAMSDAEMARNIEEQRLAAERKVKQDALAEKVKKIDELKIEPKGFWAKRSTGEKIFAGIGLFFAALTPKGAQNAVKMINDEVDQDIMLQEKNLSKEQGALSQLNKELGDIDAAKAALSVKHLQNLQLKIQENSERFRGPLAQAKAKMAQEEIDRQIALKRQEMQIKLLEKQEKNAGKQIALDEFQFTAPTDQEAMKFREAYADANKAIRAVDKLLEIEKKGSKFSVEDSATAQTLARSLQGAIRTEIIGPGTVSESDQKTLNAIVADPTAWAQLPGAARTRLMTLGKQVREGLIEKARSLGYQPASDKFASFKRK